MGGVISLSADVGGTFTDVVRVDPETGAVMVGKSPTTAGAPAAGILEAVRAAGADVAAAGRFFHGTTVGINTLLQLKGATVGLLTTRGFRDTLEVGRGDWPPYRLTWQRPATLVPRYLCREVTERILADGTVLEPLDLDEAAAQLDALVADGAEALAVCLINSYVEPGHERAIGELARRLYPSLVVTLSHDLTRRYREYERTVTAVAEAYLKPRMTAYFEHLGDGLREGGFGGQLYITSSDGGVMGVQQARDRTLRTLVSGCASGIAGAASLGATCGFPDIIAIDMGGTSFDAGLIRNGHPDMATVSEVAGLSLLLPTIELMTIGAGGGSIAWVDSAGGLDVGPRSAGAEPGPACYGRGGREATFSDAALVSGLLPDRLLGGAMALSHDAARTAIEEGVARPLGLSVEEAASGIIAIIEARMARTLEEITIGKGYDPRDFVLMAYGGGGPLVGCALADLLGIGRVVIPRDPGVFSAWGMQILDVVHEFSRTTLTRLETDLDISDPFGELVNQAAEQLAREQIEEAAWSILRFVELRYEEQEHTLLVPASETPAALREQFEDQHERTYGFRLDGAIQVVGYQVRAIGRLPKPSLPRLAAGGTVQPRSSRTVVHRESGSEDERWPVYDRAALGCGSVVSGPAAVEELTATTIVTRGRTLTVDEWGNLLLERP